MNTVAVSAMVCGTCVSPVSTLRYLVSLLFSMRIAEAGGGQDAFFKTARFEPVNLPGVQEVKRLFMIVLLVGISLVA